MWSKEHAYIILKGLTSFAYEGGGVGDSRHLFKTPKINNKRTTETDVVYVYTKANTECHSDRRKKKFE